MVRKLTGLSFPKAKSSFCAQKGMTLVELLIGIVIVAVAFLAIGGAQMSSFTNLGKSVELKDAKTFAARILEDKYQSLIFDVLNASGSDTPESKFYDYLACSEVAFAAISSNDSNGCYGKDSYKNYYEVRWRLYNELDNNSDVPVDLEGVVLLEIKVDWTEDGKDYSFSLANYLSCVYIVNQDNTTICPTPRDPTI